MILCIYWYVHMSGFKVVVEAQGFPAYLCVEEGVLAIKPVLSTSRVGHGPPCHLAEPTEQPQKRLK